MLGRSTGRDHDACVVLLVDDVDDNRELYSEILLGEGYEVVSAGDGCEAVEAVLRHHPAIVLMDLGMPVVDGYESTRRIRNLPNIEQPYIVAVSAFADGTSQRKALAAGCDEFLAKPLFPRELTRRLDEILMR